LELFFELGEIGQILWATNRAFVRDQKRLAQEPNRRLVQFGADFCTKGLIADAGKTG
jgi:hypothetical protein